MFSSLHTSVGFAVVVDVFLAREGVFGQRSALTIVDEVDGQLIALVQDVAQGKLRPSQAQRMVDDTQLAVDHAWQADADAQQWLAGFHYETVQQVEYLLQRVLAAACGQIHAGAMDRLTAQVEHCALQHCAGQIEADQMARVGGNLQQSRRLAATRRAQADLLDQSLFHEFADDRRGGGASQPAGAGNVSAAEFAVLVDEPQHKSLVVALCFVARKFFTVWDHG